MGGSLEEQVSTPMVHTPTVAHGYMYHKLAARYDDTSCVVYGWVRAYVCGVLSVPVCVRMGEKKGRATHECVMSVLSHSKQRTRKQGTTLT